MIEEAKSVSAVTNEVKSDLAGDSKQVDTEAKIEEVKDKNLNSDQQEAKSKKTIFEKIKNIVVGDTSDGNVDDSRSSLVPSDFTKAATSAGWTDKQIAEHASDYTDDELLTQIPDIVKSVENSAKGQNSSQAKAGDSKKDDDKSTAKEKDGQESEKDALIKKLVERVDKLEGSEQKNIDKDNQQVLVNRASRATKAMDGLVKEFEVFGVFEKGHDNSMPRFPDGRIIPNSPANIARNQVWELALELTESGKDFEDALAVSINAYKGEHLEKDVKRNLVKSLKRSEKKISPKHTSHEQVKTDLTGPQVVAEALKNAGTTRK